MTPDLFDGYSARIARKAWVIERVRHAPHRYREGFEEWLNQNYSIWEAFEREAHAAYRKGFKHYSARTLWEVMRHHTALREGPNALGLKLNDHWPPNLARLYLAIYPEREGFFELRGAA